MYLRIETELYLKRLIVGGFEQGLRGRPHLPQRGHGHAPQPGIYLHRAVSGLCRLQRRSWIWWRRCTSTSQRRSAARSRCQYQGKEINMEGPWTRLTMAEAVKKYSGMDYYAWESDEQARRELRSARRARRAECGSRVQCLEACFDEFVEPNLIQPTFITDVPGGDFSAGQAQARMQPDMTERFEFFANCSELGNAFSELNDPIDQRGRFESQAAAKRAQGRRRRGRWTRITSCALEYGMPPTGGLGFGVDRLRDAADGFRRPSATCSCSRR